VWKSLARFGAATHRSFQKARSASRVGLGTFFFLEDPGRSLISQTSLDKQRSQIDGSPLGVKNLRILKSNRTRLSAHPDPPILLSVGKGSDSRKIPVSIDRSNPHGALPPAKPSLAPAFGRNLCIGIGLSRGSFPAIIACGTLACRTIVITASLESTSREPIPRMRAPSANRSRDPAIADSRLDSMKIKAALSTPNVSQISPSAVSRSRALAQRPSSRACSAASYVALRCIRLDTS